MASKEIIAQYSCRRKRDFMTVSAVCFFFLIVLAELYLVFYVPVQLQREDVLQKHIARESTIKLIDNLRRRMIHLHRNSPKPQNQEILLSLQIMNDYAQYARSNLDQLSLQELVELMELLKPYEKYTHLWSGKKYIFNEEKISLQGFFGSIEKKYNL